MLPCVAKRLHDASIGTTVNDPSVLIDGHAKNDAGEELVNALLIPARLIVTFLQCGRAL